MIDRIGSSRAPKGGLVSSTTEWHISVSGQVQGVGFRPFVYNLARRLRLCGEVFNDGVGVKIRVQGQPADLQCFQQALLSDPPPMSLIEAVEATPAEPITRFQGFRIVASAASELNVPIPPDAAVCNACLQELFDPHNRRYRYPFTNCTDCGPRYSLITGLPYDRAHTTMAAFQLCPACRQEYQSPDDRRFHAQANACPACGPRLSLHDGGGRQFVCDDPVAATVKRLQAGEIIAIKGIGGFHLVCDASNDATVRRLRRRKRRPHKPFALMAANLASLQPWVQLSPADGQRLRALIAPILLAAAKAPERLPSIAPGLAWWGVMLPHSPLHYLLFHQAAGRPSGTDWLAQPQALMLVMTSANVSGAPLVIDNQLAFRQLAGIADAFLVHDRVIHSRCDDSVLSGLCQPPALIRRGRGLAPRAIVLPRSGPSVLACGGAFNATVCLTKGDRAYLSPPIGDLDNADCCRGLIDSVRHLSELLDIRPQRVACDRHPDFYSSRFAAEYSAELELPLLQVQHHHAHIAAVMAERHVQASVLGLALDGLGLGDDGGLWGGELLRVGDGGYRHLSQLRPLPLPGGDRAAREPWRVAVGVLFRNNRSQEARRRFAAQPGLATVLQMLEQNINCPDTSSAGRAFDAAAALLGIQPLVTYRAQAAMQLESLAYTYLQSQPWPEEPLLVAADAAGRLDLMPLLLRLSEVADSQYGAALFHRQLIDGLCHWVAAQGSSQQINALVLAGGCFQNQLLTDGLCAGLTASGWQTYRPEQLPCHDGGLSLGQAWIAQLHGGCGDDPGGS